MKRKAIRYLIAISLSLFFALPAWAETIKTRIGKLKFESGYQLDDVADDSEYLCDGGEDH
jgi:hypothetical protein